MLLSSEIRLGGSGRFPPTPRSLLSRLRTRNWGLRPPTPPSTPRSRKSSAAVSLLHLRWHQSHQRALFPSTFATLSSLLPLRRLLPVLLVVSSSFPTCTSLHRHRTPTAPFLPRGTRAPPWTSTTSRIRRSFQSAEKELDVHGTQQLPQFPPARPGRRRFLSWSRPLVLPLALCSLRWAAFPAARPVFRYLPLLPPRPVLQNEVALWARLVQSLNRDLRNPRPWLQP